VCSSDLMIGSTYSYNSYGIINNILGEFAELLIKRKEAYPFRQASF